VAELLTNNREVTMDRSVFRLVYRKGDNDDDGAERVLGNFGVVEVSYNGKPLTCVKRGKFEFDVDGFPLLTLELLLTDIEIDGEADIKIVTE
jgi:hypothetical protein